MGKIREVGFLIPQVHQLSGRVFSRMLKSFRIETVTPAQGRILLALWIGDDIPIQDLARRTSLKKSTLTAMLDVLEASGHVKRFPSETDRRKIHIRLTDKDKDYKRAYKRVARKVIDTAYAGFSYEEIEAIEDYLRRILENLRNAEDNLSMQEKFKGKES